MATSQSREFVVKVPKQPEMKRYSILKFGDSLNIDLPNWSAKKVSMVRENSQAPNLLEEVKQEFGEGTEYGKAAREEARRKKYGRSKKVYEHDRQAWNLTITEPSGKDRKFRSIREGGAGDHADYWIFQKVGDAFHAYKVHDWYKLLPTVTYDTLDADKAEERFQQRNKVMNQFALKAQIQQEIKKEEGEEVVTTKAASLKIKDEVSSDEEDEAGADETGLSKEKPSKKKKNVRPRKDKKVRVENADEVAGYESDDGDDEGREFDYITDSGSDTEPEEKTVEEKVEEALVGVADETGLKKMIESDEETDEDEEVPDEQRELAEKINEQNDEKAMEDKQKYMDIDKRESSESESDDPDNEKIKSAIFLQKKEAKKRPVEEANGGDATTSKKAKTEEPAFEMPKAQLATHRAADVSDEEMVRSLLQRKPHSTKELLNKIGKTRFSNLSKTEIVSRLAAILKKIEPYQFRQKVGQKEVLYFSLTTNKP